MKAAEQKRRENNLKAITNGFRALVAARSLLLGGHAKWSGDDNWRLEEAENQVDGEQSDRRQFNQRRNR